MVFLDPVWAQSFQPQFSEQNEQVFQIRTQSGIILSSSFLIYHTSTGYYFPLTEFAELVGLSIQISPQMKSVEGFIFTEDHPFQIDLETCTFTDLSKKKSKKFLCPQMILFSEEFYIQQDLIADLFELIIKTHPLKSEVVIINESLLPIYKKK